MEGEISVTLVTLALFLFWFIAFWLGGGVLFAIISSIRFLHVHKARFSCLFTLLSAGGAYAAAWMGSQILEQNSTCTARNKGIIGAFQKIGICGDRELFSAGIMWFLLVLVLGMAMMLFLRKKKKGK